MSNTNPKNEAVENGTITAEKRYAQVQMFRCIEGQLDDPRRLDYIKYWSNACGELHYHGKEMIAEENLPEELRKAYNKLWTDSYASLCYLVETPNGYGIALINEYACEKSYAEDHQVWDKEMPLYWKAACEDAAEISHHPEFGGAEIVVSEHSGCFECHELAVIFPADTNPDTFIKAAEKLDKLAYATLWKYIWPTRSPERYICKDVFGISDNIIGNPGDLLEVYDALPEKGESAESVVGYCNIFNYTTGQRWNATWNEVEGHGSLTPVETPVVSYYECEFKQVAEDGSTYAMCIKGERIPTIGEANAFLAEDIAKCYDGAPVVSVKPLTAAEAHDRFNCDNEGEWPVFR